VIEPQLNPHRTSDGDRRQEIRMTFEKSKQMLAGELADIVGMAIINANPLGIDLEKAIEEKWLRHA
jgi:NTP pyrophosphatase (non-canonical NTP hydrolase)